MTAMTIRTADILIVRSITRVDDLLIGKSRVKYIATASTGYDHIDTKYLRERGIRFFAAGGCNANAAAEYVLAAIAFLCSKNSLQFDELTVGIIGSGKIGSRLKRKLSVLGMNVLLNDPPLKDATGDETYLSLETVLRQSDIVTLHVPLTTEGRYPTLGMVNGQFMNAMRPDAYLINTARGAVVHEDSLLSVLADKRIRGAVIDVWNNEPHINTDLLEKADIGTPHIAGHSVDGKVNATVMVYNDLCSYLGVQPLWKPKNLSAPEKPIIDLSTYESGNSRIINAFLHAFPIQADDSRLRKISCMDSGSRIRYFDTIRNEKHVRREFDSYRIDNYNKEESILLSKIGFKT